MSETSGNPAFQLDRIRRRISFRWICLVTTVLLSLFAFWGLMSVPFHPDESTQLFMSADFDLLRNPISMSWSPAQFSDLRQHYRLVDSPLTKYLLGFGRSIIGLSALPSDWDWSLDWQQNQARAALPEPPLLLSGRVILALLIPLDLLFICLIGIRMRGKITGLLAQLLFGLNALVLLHDRRAMAEPALTFGVIFCLWSFLDGNRRPWLAGLAAAIAANAKQTGLFLMPVGLVAVLIPLAGDNQLDKSEKIGRMVWRIAQYLAVFSLITWSLNPVLWSHPLQAAQAAWAERQELSERQLEDSYRLSPMTAMDSSVRRLGTIVAHLFFVTPTFAETANYQEQTRDSEAIYLSIPGHNLLRGMIAGGLLLVFTLVGIVLGTLRLFQSGYQKKMVMLIMLLSTGALAIGIYTIVMLPWQRYIIPLVPITSLWAAYGLAAPFERKT